jgi:hypothetical protein
MPATYTDIVEAMIEAEKDGLDVDRVVLTEESMDTFLADDNFTKATEERQEDTIGSEWSLPIESGDGDYVVTETGEQITL